jgi:hypothetical protein
MTDKTEGIKLLLKHLEERGFRVVMPPPSEQSTPTKVYERGNNATPKKIARKAGCMCGRCEKEELVIPGAYVNLGAFGDLPLIIWVGFTEDPNETWETYNISEPNAFQTIEERIVWGHKNWTPEKTKRPPSLRERLEERKRHY